MRRHELKTWPEPFQATKRGDKPFEFRRDDRGYAVGDVLILREWEPGDGGSYSTRHGYYTDSEPLRRRVTYVLHGGCFGLAQDMAVMATAPLSTECRLCGGSFDCGEPCLGDSDGK